MSEHGTQFFIRSVDDLILKILIFAAILILVPLLWFETRRGERNNQFPSPQSIAYRKKLAQQGIETDIGRLRRTPHDVFNVPVGIAFGTGIMISAVAIGSGGAFPFAMLGL